VLRASCRLPPVTLRGRFGVGRCAERLLNELDEQAKAGDRVGKIVEVRSGRVEGTEEQGVLMFRGIPFARPPVGTRRLRPPAPEEPWVGTRDGARHGPPAPQNGSMVGAMLGIPAMEHAEDCLTLGVATPACDGARRPVMVWIHGGGFVFGAGSQATYESPAFVKRGDVVVVTVNYRLGALGWLALPGLGEEEGGVVGNFGLLDQIAALEWVRECIDRFGGDPGNVTIFGESAGAMSVGTLLAAPRAQGLFRRAILQSGACHNVAPRETGARVAELLMKELDLEASALSALRQLPAEKILEAQVRTLMQMATLVRGIPFQPTLDGDVLPEQPLDALAAGMNRDVQVLVGTNADEWKLFGLGDPKARELDDAALLRRVERNVPGRDESGRSRAERAVETYRNARRAARLPATPPDLWFAIEGDRTFGVPALRLAERKARARGGASVHKYLFTWPSPAMNGVLGACHALEIPFVFGTAGSLPALRGFVGEGPGVEKLSLEMQDAWVSFARTGDPGHAGLGEWPAFEPGRAATMVFGAASRLVDGPHRDELAFWDGLL
jgi:para-nitrobenzyl esterase